MCRVLRNRFLHGPALRPCRDALRSQDLPLEIQGGCLVFIHPEQYPHVLRAAENQTLTHADIIFTESLEYLIGETLDGGRDGAWMRSRDQISVTENSSEQDIESSEGTEELVEGRIEIDRTFLRWRPVSEASNPKARSF